MANATARAARSILLPDTDSRLALGAKLRSTARRSASERTGRDTSVFAISIAPLVAAEKLDSQTFLRDWSSAARTPEQV